MNDYNVDYPPEHEPRFIMQVGNRMFDFHGRPIGMVSTGGKMSQPWEDVDPKSLNEGEFRLITILSFRSLADMIQGVTDNWGNVCGKVDKLEGRVKTLENGTDLKKTKIMARWQFWAAVIPSICGAGGLGLILGRLLGGK